MTTVDQSVELSASGSSLDKFRVWATNPDAKTPLTSIAWNSRSGNACNIYRSSKAILSVGGCILSMDQCLTVVDPDSTSKSLYNFWCDDDEMDKLQSCISNIGLSTDLPDGSIVDLWVRTGFEGVVYVESQIVARCRVSGGSFVVYQIIEPNRIAVNEDDHACNTSISDLNLVRLGDGGGEQLIQAAVGLTAPPLLTAPSLDLLMGAMA